MQTKNIFYIVFVYVLFLFFAFDVTVSIFIEYSLNLLICAILQ